MIFEYPGTDFTIDHFKDSVSLYLSFTSHTYFDRVVSFAFSLFLNAVLKVSININKLCHLRPGIFKAWLYIVFVIPRYQKLRVVVIALECKIILKTTVSVVFFYPEFG